MDEITPSTTHRLQGRIAYVAILPTREYEIRIMQADGSNRESVSKFAFEETICFSCWSPDGQKIAFTGRRGQNYDIYTIDVDGTKRKQLTDMRTTTYGGAWSPDGQQIAFTSTRPGTEEVYVMNADGSKMKRLTMTAYLDPDPKAYNRNPAWSPDSQQLVWASARSGELEIFTMNADGSEPRQLTNSPGMKDFPSWSPDGKYIAFTAGGIYVMDRFGENLRQLTNPEFIDMYPGWSPDGEYLIYSSQVGVDRRTRPMKKGHPELFVMHVASGESWRLTHSDFGNDCPSWIL